MPLKYSIKFPTQIHTKWQKILIARRIAPAPKGNLKKDGPKNLFAQTCFLRYKTSKSIHNKQFKEEVMNLEAMQPTGWDAMRFHRLFSVTTLWPPLHSRNEIAWTFRKLDSNVLSANEKRKLQRILKT